MPIMFLNMAHGERTLAIPVPSSSSHLLCQHFTFMVTKPHVKRFSRMTKEMTHSHRLDLLTDGLLHYGRKKSTDIEVHILQRRDKAEKTSQLVTEDLSRVLMEAPVSVSELDVRRWRDEERLLAEHKQRPKDSVSKLKREYVLLLLHRHNIGLNDNLTALERKLKIPVRWEISDPALVATLRDMDMQDRTQLLSTARAEAKERMFLISLKKKYPDGQAIAIKLSKQIQLTNKRTAKAVKRYNSIKWPPQNASFPRQIEVTEAYDPSSPVYLCLDDGSPVCETDPLPASLKRRAIDALTLKDQALEESGMVLQEMRAVIEYLHLQHAVVKKAVDDHHHQSGQRAALIKHTIHLEKRLHMATNMFSAYIELPTPPAFYLETLDSVFVPPSSEVLEQDDEEEDELEEEEEEDLRWG
ncbi:hypothetical protein SKAU_G00245470 [Synaphobranchus kaupii]|uniref:Uncharacterized protein n=1 Tax=Synaphobranchus kaupii TaxID=118154 RepID=A0A9Q1IRD0_SYNKA|nr:hypothetical protein SKAU_G00245470 [Synaphobranchus kaupii]